MGSGFYCRDKKGWGLSSERENELRFLRLFLKRAGCLLEKKPKANSQAVAELREIMNKTIPLYEKTLEVAKESLKRQWSLDPKLFKPTTFEVMDYGEMEQVHSNVIAYMLNKPKVSKLFLKNFLSKITDADKNVSAIIESLESTDFRAIREYTIKSKHIDILIKGIVGNKFNIVIENKFRAKQHYITEKISQTKFYMREIKQLYPVSDNVFILLDFKSEAESPDYHSLDYVDLEHAVEETLKGSSAANDDHIIQEYLFLLKRLVNGITMTRSMSE
jgi:hypothetical protein